MESFETNKKINVFIFCAGKGTRLRPYTYKTPKPLLQFKDGHSFLFKICKSLKTLGLNEAFVNYSYGKRKFIVEQNTINDRLDFKIHLIKEEEPLGHGGALRNAKRYFTNNLILGINGDTLFNLKQRDLEQAVRKCTKNQPLVVFTKHTRTNNVIQIASNNSIIGVHNKLFVLQEYIDRADAAGLYLLQKSALDLIKPSGFFGMWGKDDLVERIIRSGKKVIAYNIDHIKLVSIGTKQDYEKAIR